MFRFSTAATTILASAMLAFTAIPASAATTPSSDAIAAKVYSAPDPAAAFSALPADQQKVFAARMSTWAPVESASSTTKVAPTAAESKTMGVNGSAALAAGGGCWSQYKYYKWYDLGVNTGDTWMTAHWCSNGSSVTSWSLSNRGGQGYVGIAYKGLGGTYVNNVGWEVRQAQSFKFSVVWASANPCMQIRGGKTGLQSFRATCDLS